MQLTIETDDIQKAITKLQKLSHTAQTLTPIHRHIGNILQNSIEQSFEDEKSPFGQVWKKSKKPTGKTLTKSGTLSSSFTVDADDEGVSVGTNLVYAPIPSCVTLYWTHSSTRLFYCNRSFLNRYSWCI